MEQKKYTINGKEFVFGKLTWKQRQLSSTFEKKLREKISEIYALQQKGPDIDVAKVFELSVNIDDLFYEDRELLNFLATILTPEGSAFDATKIEELSRDMENINEDTLSEILQDFFGRTRKFMGTTKNEASPSA